MDRRLQELMRVIVRLGRQRDRILESPRLDLEALAKLVEDYEEAGMASAAAAMRRRLAWYREENFSAHSRGRAPRD